MASIFGRRAAGLWLGTLLSLFTLAAGGALSPAQAATYPCTITPSDIPGLQFVNAGDGSFQLGGVLTSANITATTGGCNNLTSPTAIRPLKGGVGTSTLNLEVTDATSAHGSLIRTAAGEVQYKPPSTTFSGTDTFTIDNNNTGRVINVTVVVTLGAAVPQTTGLSPTSGPAAGGNTVIVTGTDFTGATFVHFGPNPASAFTVNSATQITATAPAGSGNNPVNVTTAAGTGTGGTTYTYIAAPAVSAVSPAAGPASGGTSVVVTGVNFTAATAVTFGATAATGFTVNSATQITATAPGGSGTVDVRVTTVGGTSATSAADQFTYVAAPTVSSISPTAGPAAGGTTVTLTGANFAGATAVTFGATAATGFTVNSATQITATAPSGSGTVDIRVTTVGGTSPTSAADQFTYVAAPTVSSISPAAGPAAGGTTVTLTGANFAGTTAVTFGATAAIGFTVDSATQITATAPGGSGTVDVRVTTVGGTSATSAADQFTYVAVPTVDGISPASGPTSGGTAVTITGTGFTGASAVTIGGVSPTGITVVNATTITATTAAHAAGAASVLVTATGGTNVANALYSYVAAPVAADRSGVAAPYGTATAVDVSSSITGVYSSIAAAAGAHGTTSVAGSVITYTPAAGYYGADSFTYTATGPGGASAPATVSLTVATPAAPVAADRSGVAAPYGTATAVDVSSSITGVYSSIAAAAGAHGTTSVAGSVITYTPAAGYYGADSFTYTATGPGGASAPATVTLTVATPAAPTAAPASANVAYNSTGQTIGLTATGVYSTLAVATAPAHGTVTITGATATYVPATNYFGADSFTYTATGPGGASAPATVSLTVATPAAPVAADRSGVAAPYGTATAVDVSSSITGVYSSIAAAAGAHGTTSVAGSVITYTPAAGYYGADSFTYTATGPGGASAPATVTLTVATPAAPVAADRSGVAAPYGTATAVDVSSSVTGVYSSIAATAGAHGTTSVAGSVITYTPAAGYYGADSFTYTATGPGGTSAPATVTLTVATPAAPVAADRSGVAAPYGTATAVDVSSSVTGVYSSIAATAGAHGTTSVAGSVITYTPAAGYYGADSFTYTATGPGGASAPATVTLTVATPAAPVAADRSGVAAPYGTATAVDVSSSVTGVYSSIAATAGAHGTTSVAGSVITYTPAAGYYGADSFTYTATGPGGASAPATVSLTVATPAAPVVAPASANVAYNSTGQTIGLTASGVYSTLAVATAPAHGTVTITGATATYVPTTDYFGADSFTYVATGPGGASAPATVSLTVATPAAPTAAPASANVAYNVTGQAIGLTASGVYSTLDVATAPAHGTVTITGATATYVPATDYFGADSFTYTATGPGGTSAPATVSLTVATPPPPVVTPPPPVTTPAPAGGTGDPVSVSIDLPTTTSGEVTNYRISAGPLHGSAVIETVSGTGSLSGMLQISAMPIHRLRYTPAANFLGTDTVTIVATGPGGDSAPAVFTFLVPGKAPDLSAQVTSNTSVTLSPTSGLTGGPFQALRITRQPSFGTATVSGLTLVFAPGVRNGGSTSLDYVIDLPFGASAAGRIDLVSNRAPTAMVLTARTPAGRPVTVRITDGALGGPFTGAAVTGVTPAGSATAVLVQGGTAAAPVWDLTVTPQGTFTGDTVIGFTLTNAFASTAGTLTVTVDPRPDPSLDPDVRGVVSSQVESARRFAGAQTDNFNRRLEQLRQGRKGDSNMLSVNAGFASDGSLLDPRAGLQQQLGGVRAAFGDEALRARLGLQDQDQDRFGGRDRNTEPFVQPQAGDGLAAGPAADENPMAGKASAIGVWAAGGIDWGRRDATTGTRDYRFSTSGVSAGSDMMISDSLIVGVGTGYGFDRTKVGAAGSRSEGRSIVVAAYGGWKISPSLTVDGVLGYGDLSYDSRRWATAASAGAGAYAFGDRKGDMVFGSLSLAWDQHQGEANRSIYGRVEAQSVTLDGFTETGADIYALSYDQLDFDSFSSTLGLRYDWRVEQGHGSFRPAVRLEWTHAFDHAGPQTVSYADWLTSPRYGVALDGWDRDTVELGLEGGWKIGDSLDLTAGYRAAMGSNTASHGLQLKLMAKF